MKGWVWSTLIVTSATVALSLARVAPPALAEDVLCIEEAKKFCPGVEPGGGRIVKCLEQHMAELSVDCRGKIARAKALASQQKTGQAKAKPKACAADQAKYCEDVPAGEGRVVKCLKEHQARLSAECAKALAAAQK